MIGIQKGAPHLDLTGEAFGDLTVIARVKGEVGSPGKWLCRCTCGQERLQMTNMLKAGRAKSCGCTKDKRIGDKKRTHGHSPSAGNSRTYRIWTNMKTRCMNPKASNFAWYGARGVGVDPEWIASFDAFLRDMGPAADNMTLDRIDPAGNYCLENCRWASWAQQQNNRRCNRMVEVRGERMTMSEAARKCGMTAQKVWQRLSLGWSDEEAVGMVPRDRAACRGAASA